MFVRAGIAWKSLLHDKATGRSPNRSTGRRVSEQRQRSAHMEYDPTPVLLAQRDDIIGLWKNPEVQEILTRRRPLLKRSSGL
jgi:hypothetical protein